MLAVVKNNMKYKIGSIIKIEYNEVVNIWEASVRATHHFLKEEDIQYFKSLVYEPFFSRI